MLRALQQQRPARFLQRREQRKALALFRLQQKRVVKAVKQVSAFFSAESSAKALALLRLQQKVKE